MSRWTEEARSRGWIDGAHAFNEKRLSPAEVPYRRGRLRRAYLDGWEQGWWAAGFGALRRVIERMDRSVKRAKERRGGE